MNDVAQLVESHLGFVVRVATEYRNKGVPFEDLVNAGNLGLVVAARRYDGSRGHRFVTYAAFWIRKSMIESIYRANVVRVTRHGVQKQRLADAGAVGAAAPPLRLVSLDAPRGAQDERTVGESLADARVATPEEDAILAQQLAQLRRALLLLDDRERTILGARFGFDGVEPESRGVIGRRLGISRERVRQIEREVLGRLRAQLLSGAVNRARDTRVTCSGCPSDP